MGQAILTLGGVPFQDFEIPPTITFGGGQNLAVHQLPGGSRVVDALGANDAAITWAGVFSGANATERARMLDLARVTGIMLPLTWDVFFYTVVISTFAADYSKGWWIPYKIACTVVRDEASVVVPILPTLAGSVNGDLAAAAAAAPGLNLNGAMTALAQPNATARGTANYAAALTSLQTAQSGAQSQIAANNTQLGALAAQPTPTGPYAASQGAGAITQAVGLAGSLASLTTAEGYIGRALVNLGNASA